MSNRRSKNKSRLWESGKVGNEWSNIGGMSVLLVVDECVVVNWWWWWWWLMFTFI